MRDHLLPAARDPLDALREAIHALPVPGAPPSLSRESAAIGLAFLDNDLAFIHLLLVGSRGEDADDADGDGVRAADAVAGGDPGPGVTDGWKLSTDPQLALSAGSRQRRRW